MSTIQTSMIELPHGIKLSCRSAGHEFAGQNKTLVFLHGFPEGAFIWDETLLHFAAQGYYCIAPNLRGFEHSSSPIDAEKYRAKYLVQDICALLDLVSPHQPVAALIAHDWGGAVAWGLANSQAQKLKKLVIINSPHPATFLRDLKIDPIQQQASAYMNFLCRPDAEKLLSENDYQRLFEFFTRLGAADGQYAWLDNSNKEKYRNLWNLGLTGGCNYYRASPLKPAIDANSTIHKIEISHEALTVNIPTQVIWGMKDVALPPGLLRGLEDYIPELQIHKIDDATHWVIHEQRGKVHALMQGFLQ